MSETKIVKVSKSVWKKLMEIKLATESKSVDEVIQTLLGQISRQQINTS